MFKIAFWVFVVTCIMLGWLGAQPAEGIYVILARIFTLYYFAFFLVLMPLLGIIETPKPVPNSISEDVLAKSKKKGVLGAHELPDHPAGSGAGRPEGATAAPKKD